MSVGADTARVRFIVDTRSVVIAVDQATRALGEVRGQPGGQLVMGSIPVNEAVEPGATIVSAGLTYGTEASRYPGGLLIGTVQVFFEPRQAPLHERSFHPFAGVAVSRTGTNEGKVAPNS